MATAKKDPARQKLVRVYTASDEMEARMVAELLQNAGIESLVNSEVAPGIFPTRVGDFARQDILVFESTADEARKIIEEQHEAGEDAPEAGPDDAA